MSAPVSFTLVVFAGDNRRGGPPYMTASVQCWREGQCIQTVDLATGWDFDWPDGADLSTAETFGAVTARVVARKLEDVAAAAIKAGSLNHRTDLEGGTPGV